MRVPTTVVIAVAIAAVPAQLQAQGDAHPGLLSGAEFRSVSYGAGIGTKTMSEFAVPIGATLPLGRRVTVDFGTYFVSATRTAQSGASTSLSGLTDVILRGAFQLKPDVAVLTVALNLPTGNGTLDTAEGPVASAAGSDLIPYPVQNFGSGFNVTTGLAFATPIGPWAVGLAGSYRYNGSYEPLLGDTTSLTPGGEVRVRLGADRIVGQGRVSLGLTYSTFSSDEFGSSVYRPGSRIIPQLSWSVPLGNNSLAFYGWDIYRAVKDTVGVKENTLAFGAILSLRTGRHTLRPTIEYRKAWAAPADSALQSNGMLFGVGVRYAIMASNRLTIVPLVRVDLGNYGPSSVSFTGFTAGLTLRASF
jgi:hypothetical protein